MAFPTIPTVAAGRVLFTLNTAGGATKTFPNLSSLTKAAGDLLIAICVEYDGNSTDAEFSGWGGGFTEFGDRAGTATMAIGAAYKWSTGSETGTFTVTTADTTTNDSVMILLAIPGAHATTPPEMGVMTTAAPGVPPAVGTALNPTGWDAEDTLWIAVAGSGETATGGAFTDIVTAPSSYVNIAVSGITADVVGGITAAVAFRQLNAASEAPGAWEADASNARGAATVIAVRPVPATSQTATAEVSLAPGSEPATRTAHSIKIRARTTAGAGTMRVALYEGATNITDTAPGYLETGALTTSLADYTLAIADADAAAIGSYEDLGVRFWGYAAAGGAIVFEVDQVWLEIPAAAAVAYVPRHGFVNYQDPGVL